jgi:hypothetical protein
MADIVFTMKKGGSNKLYDMNLFFTFKEGKLIWCNTVAKEGKKWKR